jgi:hypothetical protein
MARVPDQSCVETREKRAYGGNRTTQFPMFDFHLERLQIMEPSQHRHEGLDATAFVERHKRESQALQRRELRGPLPIILGDA